VLPGIQKGIEKWSRILTILLLLLLVMLAAYACTLPGFKDALRFLFHFDLSELRWEGVLEALGLSLFTLSLAQGVIITYGSYVQPEEDLPKIAWIIGISVGVISLLTVLTIFPVIFTFHLPPEEGTGLVFKTLPVLFTELPGSMVLSTLFFALFTFTGLTSAVSLLEVSAAHLIDLYQWGRKKAVFCAALAACIVGIPSALAGSHTLFKSWSSLYGSDFFTTLDQLISNWFLPIGALLISLYIGWHMKKEAVRDEFLRGSTMPSYFSIWYALIRWLAPLAISLILLQKGSVH
jgi:NSS family neurotransmitter:Na+ symporter